ncbi:ScbA/BarX family gamma-butyrolactone biosynthesis protein [Streptomyces sp. NPDC093097]|uniref:ScbA/BarX family gamma-butyrolactone biosynthesis protein n=1 Tax=Streptomyces sp. NPDC093097 TaxID=3366027 RepID=UPI0037F22660
MSDTLQVSSTLRPTPQRRTQSVRNHPATARSHGAEDAAVPGELVHRPRPEDVLITSWQRLGEGHFSLTGQWPHDHRYFAPSHGRHHLVLAGETIRQAGLLLSHSELGVPVGHHFILSDLVYTTHPEHTVSGSGPTPLIIDVRCSDTRMRAGALAGSRFDMTIRTGGRLIATGYSHVSVTSPGVYRRIRGERLTARSPQGPLNPPVPPELTGSATDREVLLSPTGRPDRWLLRIAPGHPTVVNPANDHVPGLALLDAALQAGRALLAPDRFVPFAFGTEFRRYAEHGTPCVIEARRIAPALPGTTTVEVIGAQDGEPVFTSTLTALDPSR